jgi:hypothetical protein
MDDRLEAQTTTVPRRASTYDWLPGNDLIKIVAMVLMAIDHVGWAFSRDPALWRALGRGAFPLFAALLVVGMRRTRDPHRYLMRLAVFALVSQYPFALCFEGLNIGFTLAVGGLALYAGEDFLERNRQAGRPLKGWLGWVVLMTAASLVAGPLRMDYGSMGILAMAILQRSPTAWVGIPLMMGWTALFGWLNQWWAASWGALVVGAVLLLGWWLRGWRRRFLPRWIVYAFYPVHLAIIGILLATWGPGGQAGQLVPRPAMSIPTDSLVLPAPIRMAASGPPDLGMAKLRNGAGTPAMPSHPQGPPALRLPPAAHKTGSHTARRRDYRDRTQRAQRQYLDWKPNGSVAGS